jgi:hypothetical protein
MRLLLLIPFLFLAPLAHADLKWDKLVQEFKRVPDDKEIEAHYVFHNTGTTPVTIKSMHSSCGCTTAKLEKKTYAPGEQGDVVLHFSFGDRKGNYLKAVTVTTDDKNMEPVILKLYVEIHDPLTVAPALVFWRTGEAPAAKTVQLTAEAAQHVKIKSVTSSNPNFTATLQTGQAGLNYTIAITPSSTAQKESADITVQTDFPADAPHTYTIFARVK